MTTTTAETRAGDQIDLRDSVRGDQTVSVRPRPKLGYLPALDGLRAIAVLAVLFFHADLPWAPGGFLGVDVFFVLSGFLITTLLIDASVARGRPDLKQFYLRRARRLLPALFLVLIGSTFLVVTVATDNAANQQRDLPGALFYVTNWIYVFNDQSYFEAIGRPPMLEHLWSLAVEEQFYLIWPWVFLLAWKLGRSTRVRLFALIGALASTAAMIAISAVNGYPANDPSRVYFGTDTHAMGLLLGAWLATLWVPGRVRRSVALGARASIDAAGAVALIVLLVIFWRIDYQSPLLYFGGFLVLSALVAFLIAAVTHPASRVGRVLGAQPWRWIGQRSYGIYLWHWPVFLVTRPDLDVPLSGTANLALRFGLTFALAELSYRYVEMPIRELGFRGAWAASLAKLRHAGTVPARIAAKPSYLLAAVGLVLVAMLVRLYTIPPQTDYLGGVSSLSVTDGSERFAGDPVPTLQVPTSRVQPGYLGIGESVMIGANEGLQGVFGDVAVDADVGRQADQVIARIGELAAAGQLRENVILHFGTNGPIGEGGVRAVLDQLSEVDRVVVVNVSAPRRWQDANNAVLTVVVPEFQNAILVDWHREVLANPSLVVKDGVHPSTAGIARYSEIIKQGFADLEARNAEVTEPVSGPSVSAQEIE